MAKLGHSRIDGLVKPVRPQSLDSAVLDALSSYVDRANILPDSRLPSERVLCEALGVGRSTVREALKRWEALGIVEMRKGSGAYLKVAFRPKPPARAADSDAAIKGEKSAPDTAGAPRPGR